MPEVGMVSQRTLPFACVAIIWAICSCNRLFVPGTSKQVRTLGTGRREQIPGHASTVQEQTLRDELELRARTLRVEASLAEAALTASRASRAQQESYEQLKAPVGLYEEERSVACTRESTKPERTASPRSETPGSSIIPRFAACIVVALFWVSFTAGWYAIMASTFYSTANDHRMELATYTLNHGIHHLQ